MRPLVQDHIAALQPYEPGKPISEVERELGISGCVKLASNENPLGPSPLAMEALREALPNVYFYPDGGGFHLRRKLSRRFGFPPSQILLGNGSNEIIEHLVRTFMAPGHHAISSAGSFVIYKLVVLAAGHEFREAPLGPDLGYDLDAMARLVDRDTRLVFLSNPNNPTGTSFGDEDFARFVREVDRRAAPGDPPILVLDEAYREYVERDDLPDGEAWVRRRDRTVTMRTFSKAYGLAGVRCGYGFASEAIVANVNRVRAPFNVSSLALVAGEAALDDDDFIRRSFAMNRDEKAFLVPELRRRGLSVVPTQTNFHLVDFHRDAREVFRALMARGVITRPMNGYDLPTCQRITIGSRDENLRLLAAIDEIEAVKGERIRAAAAT